jgi:hypothetical protein
MKSRTRNTFRVFKWLVLALVLTLAPAALASTTWYVDGVNGNDSNDCLSSQTACQTIGHTISLCASGDSIMVAPAVYTENLPIDRSLKIIGSDAATTIVDGNQAGTVFTINGYIHVTLSKMTIRNGLAVYGGGIRNSGTLTVTQSTVSGNTAEEGGGGYNSGTLTMFESTVSGNAAGLGLPHRWAMGAGIYNTGSLTINRSTVTGNIVTDPYWAKGGGICNYKTGGVTINNSTVSYNQANIACSCSGSYGGGIDNAGTLAINNSTISENFIGQLGDAYGGGIDNTGTLTINNTTISHNTAYGQWASVPGIYNDSSDGYTATLQNSIVALNRLWAGVENCAGTMTSNGYNLSSDDTCNFNGPGDMNNTKPRLGKLGNNGGPTQTIRLLKGSPAIDAGNPNGCTDDKGNLLKTDQRGWRRPGKSDTGACDIGAFEVQHD